MLPAGALLRSPRGLRRRRRRARMVALAIAAPLAVGGIAAAIVAEDGGGSGHAANARLLRSDRTGGSAGTAAAATRSSTGTAPRHAVGTPSATTGARSATAGAHAAPTGTAARAVAEVRDPEEAKSYPVPANALAHRHAATTPTRAAEAFVAPGALSTGTVKQELAHLQQIEHAEEGSQTTVPGGDSVGGNGTIPIPPDVPTVIQKIVAGANAITDYPYVYGGGHASFVDNAYDCSGSISYALAAGGLLSAPETSGQLESWGAPGPGNWLTIYANEGHVYMYVNIGGGVWMRYDTVGRSGPYASRWQPDGRSNAGFVARHWPGL